MPKSSPWLIFDREPEQGDVILFCLHFAGGHAALFRQWQEHAPAGVSICRVQLPGHGTRMSEPLLLDMPTLLAGLHSAAARWMGHRYALFGHSMGGTIAAEWAIRIQQENLPPPVCLFVSASEPPHKNWLPPCRNLPEDKFRALVFEAGGLPQEVMEHEELMSVFEPILRADYTVLETWAPQPVRPVHAPMIALAYRDDRVVPEEIVAEWQRFAASSWEMLKLPGEHFFIQVHPTVVMSAVFERLKEFLHEGMA